jgi:hypothetical protein
MMRSRCPLSIIHHSSFIILTFVLCLRSALADTPSTGPASPASRPSGTLRTVSDLMSQAGQRLGAGKPDTVTQKVQLEAVALLDRLIEQAEQQEKQQQQSQCKACGGKGCRLCKKTATGVVRKPSSPARQSTVSPGPGGEGELRPAGTARPGEAWGNMRPEEREKILQSLGKDFPSQYRQLVEQYYKQLAKEE